MRNWSRARPQASHCDDDDGDVNDGLDDDDNIILATAMVVPMIVTYHQPAIFYSPGNFFIFFLISIAQVLAKRGKGRKQRVVG